MLDSPTPEQQLVGARNFDAYDLSQADRRAAIAVTADQLVVHRAVVALRGALGRWPSGGAVCDRTGLHQSTVWGHVRKLAALGLARVVQGRIEILAEPDGVFTAPLRCWEEALR